MELMSSEESEEEKPSSETLRAEFESCKLSLLNTTPVKELQKAQGFFEKVEN